MKRIIATVCMLMAFALVSANQYVKPVWSINTAAIFYGDSAIDDFNKNLKSQGFQNIVIGGEVGMSIQLDSHIDFVALPYLVLDAYSKQFSSLMRLDYGVSAGVRLRSGLGGLEIGCLYCTGRRSDVVSMSEEELKATSTQWGNGYSFTLEYDFSDLVDGVAPVIGISWRRMPRGNNVKDGILGFLFRLVG